MRDIHNKRIYCGMGGYNPAEVILRILARGVIPI